MVWWTSSFFLSSEQQHKRVREGVKCPWKCPCGNVAAASPRHCHIPHVLICEEFSSDCIGQTFPPCSCDRVDHQELLPRVRVDESDSVRFLRIFPTILYRTLCVPYVLCVSRLPPATLYRCLFTYQYRFTWSRSQLTLDHTFS